MIHSDLFSTDQNECLYLCLWGTDTHTHTWAARGGFSQLTCCQSAVKQVLCSLPGSCPGHGKCWPRAPSLSRPLVPLRRGWLHPKVLTIHGLAPQVVTEVMERLPQQQPSSTVYRSKKGGEQEEKGDMVTSPHVRTTVENCFFTQL